MVAPQEEKVLRVLDLVGQKQTYALNRLFSTVDIVPQEKVVSVARKSSILEELNEI